jgi:DNA polymerase III delta prime subunit
MPDESSYADQGPAEVKPLTEEQLILCVPWAKGFVLKEKKWYQLAVDCIKDITWNDSFSNLVLPHQEKDLLLAFAQSKINASANDSDVQVFDDFVDGKGRGVIILLSGSPGVGKTLTAESIAEKMKVPLYTLSAGEIGIMPSTVETEIKAALEKCAKWNAILLLDEADVFLEKRELNSLKRNELVSIFLRLLEYYEGMMFLTTNRVSTIDPAFESRIDVSINYPDLTAELRFQIWAKFLFRSEQIRSGLDLSENDLGPLARLNLNGRQIKSAIKTAQLLATSKGEKLSITHLNAVLKLHRSLT